VPRLAVGTNEYFYALSGREPAAVRCALHCLTQGSGRVLRLGWPPSLSLPPHSLPHVHASLLRPGGRSSCSRWEITPEAADPPLHILRVKLHQQFESPAAVMTTVHRLWQPNFDAMATPFSAICANYATLEDDVLSPNIVPPGSRI
jgi:hypothetical protein